MNANHKPESAELDDAANDAEGAILARAVVPEQLGAALIGNINTGKPYFWTSLKNTSREDRLNAVRYLTDKENGIDDILFPNSFEVTNVIITQASWHDADGRLIVTPKCVLIDKEGKHVCILAKVWVVEFIGLFLFMGNPPWTEPIEVSAKQAKGTGANRYYTLHLP